MAKTKEQKLAAARAHHAQFQRTHRPATTPGPRESLSLLLCEDSRAIMDAFASCAKPKSAAHLLEHIRRFNPDASPKRINNAAGKLANGRPTFLARDPDTKEYSLTDKGHKVVAEREAIKAHQAPRPN